MVSFQRCAAIISNILVQRGHEICSEKTKLVLFSKYNLYFSSDSLSLTLNNIGIYPSEIVKFPGIILDHQLPFNDHFAYLTEKCRKIFNIVRVLRGFRWGANLCVLSRIYDALIRAEISSVGPTTTRLLVGCQSGYPWLGFMVRKRSRADRATFVSSHLVGSWPVTGRANPGEISRSGVDRALVRILYCVEITQF